MEIWSNDKEVRKRNLRLLFYLHRFPAIGGIENITTTLANAFVEKEIDVAIVSCFGVCEKQFGLNTKVSLFSLRNNSMKRILGEFNPDVIIFQDSYAPIAHKLFREKLSVPVIVCEHSAPFWCYTRKADVGIKNILAGFASLIISRLKYLRDRWRRRFLYKRCARYVLLSPRFYNEFRAVARLAEVGKLAAIPNVAPEPVVCDSSKRKEILFVGALNESKGCDLLIRAWAGVCHALPDWSLVFVGDGEMRKWLEEFARENSLSNVRFEGWKKDPTEYFKRAMIFAFPSRREGWGLVLTEAQAYGCIPIALDSYASVRDIITPGENGILIEEDDVDAFGNKLISLASDKNLLERLSANARDSVKRYSLERIVEQWMVLIQATVSYKG